MAGSFLEPIRLGAIDAPNRIIMAPLTRGRAGPGFVPNELAREYYRQRASAGLIISEATGISQEGLGWPSAPGLWTDAQVEGWKPVTDAVHEAGGRIVAQLWHMGRVVHSVFNDGKPPVSASATSAPGKAHTPIGRLDYEVARPLELAEIPRVIADYAAAAENAKRAGFDGVQLHGANGYLIDQFLRDGTNLRDDDYGGPVENRIRLLREVTEALIGVWGKERVRYRISPNNPFNAMQDSDPVATFSFLAGELAKRGIGYLHVIDPVADGAKRISPLLRGVFKGTYIVNGGFDAASAEDTLERKAADLVAFGVPFLANPDLPERYRQKATLNAPDQGTFYQGEAKGYVDYPALV